MFQLYCFGNLSLLTAVESCRGPTIWKKLRRNLLTKNKEFKWFGGGGGGYLKIGDGVFPYMGYIGMFRCEEYGFPFTKNSQG